MKLAPWVMLTAIGLLVGVTGWSERPSRTLEKELALDFTGVNTLDMSGIHGEVVLVAPGAEMLVLHPDRLPPIVRRDGDTLVITEPAGANGYTVGIVAPSTLQRLVGAGSEVIARTRVVDLEIERTGGGYTSWEGDATRLRIVSRQDPQCTEGCGSRFSIGEGDVGYLSVSLDNGTVVLHHADRIRSIELELGEEADYDLEGLRGPPPPLKVTRLGVPSVAAPAPQMATPEPATKPPRVD